MYCVDEEGDGLPCEMMVFIYVYYTLLFFHVYCYIMYYCCVYPRGLFYIMYIHVVCLVSSSVVVFSLLCLVSSFE